MPLPFTKAAEAFLDLARRRAGDAAEVLKRLEDVIRTGREHLEAVQKGKVFAGPDDHHRLAALEKDYENMLGHPTLVGAPAAAVIPWGLWVPAVRELIHAVQNPSAPSPEPSASGGSTLPGQTP